MVFFPLIHVKMPTVVSLLTFMSGKIFRLNLVEFIKSFVTSGPDKKCWFAVSLSTKVFKLLSHRPRHILEMELSSLMSSSEVAFKQYRLQSLPSRPVTSLRHADIDGRHYIVSIAERCLFDVIISPTAMLLRSRLIRVYTVSKRKRQNPYKIRLMNTHAVLASVFFRQILAFLFQI